MATRPRGTRDFGPEEMAARQHVGTQLRGTFARFGFHEVQTPTFEELALFTAKSGDGIIDELYDFQDKGGRHLTLRPEITAPVMRFYFAEHQFDAKPLKWFYHSNCFRYDRPQTGRYREFWQFGCELIGAGTPMAYAELIALADACLAGVGLQDYRLRIGHVGVLGQAVDALGMAPEARKGFMRLLDKGDREGVAKLCAESGVTPEALEGFWRVLDAPTPGDSGVAHPGVEELESCLLHLDDLGVDGTLDLSIARGLDYYTGIVFEVHCDSLGAQSQVLGGGGYDLSAVFAAQPTPTMGFGLGFDRVLVALEAQGRLPVVRRGPNVCLGALGEAAQAQVLRWAAMLRQQGVSVEVDLLGRKPGQIAKWADSMGADRLVILGDRDLDRGSVQVKDLASGEARVVPLDDVVGVLLVV